LGGLKAKAKLQAPATTSLHPPSNRFSDDLSSLGPVNVNAAGLLGGFKTQNGKRGSLKQPHVIDFDTAVGANSNPSSPGSNWHSGPGSPGNYSSGYSSGPASPGPRRASYDEQTNPYGNSYETGRSNPYDNPYLQPDDDTPENPYEAGRSNRSRPSRQGTGVLGHSLGHSLGGRRRATRRENFSEKLRRQQNAFKTETSQKN
jgi:hypothetical protein